MSQNAQVSIVVPLFNDEEHVAAALDSCLSQTLTEIEVIVVDDASTDGTASIVESYAAADNRIRLIRQATNQSAFQARRVGINAASAPFVLFLDGDDELVPEATATALAMARAESADVVAFGCMVVRPDGSTGGAYQAAMQPRHSELIGPEITNAVFPVGKTAQGQLWRYLFGRDLLKNAYAALPATLILPRANDLPIAFLALMYARKYVSTPTALYRYFFRRGASGHRITAIDEYRFIASAIDSIDAIRQAVLSEVATRPEDDPLLGTYESARLSVIGRVLDYVREIVDDSLSIDCVEMLTARVGRSTLITASSEFCPKALPVLAATAPYPELTARTPEHILLRASNLGTGGAQGVVIAQARHLAQTGYRVTIALDAVPDTHFRLPDGVQVLQLIGASRAQRLAHFAELCHEHKVDVVIDHYVFYNDRWPYFALMAAEQGVPTIGWIHNFALRPVLDGTERLSFLERYLPILSTVVVLSETDVTYWKTRGVDHVVYLPNPPSPLLEHLPHRTAARPAPTDRLEIVWWGRLQQSTKQVRELIEIATALDDFGVDFKITVIGPDGPDLTVEQLHEMASVRGLDDRLETPGPLHGDALVAAVADAHVFVSTSIVEGYPLALVEAQALGLPLVMYDLPWLATLRDNAGVVSVAQSDRGHAARALALLSSDRSMYESLSLGALAAAERALAHDFDAMYSDLVRGVLDAKHSPEPNMADVRLLLDQNVLFLERLVRRKQRALDAARADATGQRKKATRLGGELERARRLAKQRSAAPSVARSGIKGLLQRILPATMRQASYYARHQHSVSERQHNQLLANQYALEDRLARIDVTLQNLATDQPATPALVTRTESRLAEIGQTLVDALDGTRDDITNTVEYQAVLLRSATDQLSSNVQLVAANSTRSSEAQQNSSRALRRVQRAADEAVWSAVFHDTIAGSAWFTDPALSPGRWAVGYPFLYVLYRVLDEVAPISVLELGLGQSTKLIAQYAQHHSRTQHIVVEHDAHWVETFAANYSLPERTHITQLDLIESALASGETLPRYDGFAHAVGGQRFDLIVIDGPFGSQQGLSRIDVLDILPGSLGDRFVIMLDDAERPGEEAAAKLIVAALNAAGIPHRTKIYRGQKDVWIAVSEDLQFLATL